MQFLKIASALAMAIPTVLGGANVVSFKSIDDLDRTVYFTANAGLEALDPVEVAAGKTVNVTFPHAWIGNYYSVTKGAANKPGMLGEVAFNGWNGFTYFDVSAIVDPTDLEGVSQMYPASQKTPTSGCITFPCNNAYYVWDDVQTKVTGETHLVTTLGKNGYAAALKEREHQVLEEVEEDSVAVKRSFVEGKWFAKWGF